MKVFNFDGRAYKDERALRTVLWRKRNLLVPNVMSDGAWQAVGVIVEEVAQEYSEEQLANMVRSKRDRLLSACDYYVMPDYPATEEALAEVKVYRQALRDITEQDGFPSAITWPEKPEVL